MTAQTPEILLYEGVEYPLFTTPLEDLWEGIARPEFVGDWTSEWRGYRATWLIKSERLYLASLVGRALADSSGRPLRSDHRPLDAPISRSFSPARRVGVTLETLFPEETPPIFASWYTGQLHIPQGDEVHYEHMGFLSVYEWDWVITVHKGSVVGSDRVATGEMWRQAQDELARSRSIPRTTRLNPDGWITCPHCGSTFPNDPRFWDQIRHKSCGGRIELLHD